MFGFSLNYFDGDYKTIETAVSNTFTSNTFSLINADSKKTANQLYNGNIAAMLVNIPKIGEAQLYGYKYDQLNRIVSMDAFTGLNNVTNTFTAAATSNYKERVTYDANGNIKTYLRNGDAARLAMDEMTSNSSGTYYNRAKSFQQLGELDKALRDLDEAVRHAPNVPEFVDERGTVWRKKKSYDKAIADYTEAIRLSPSLTLTYYWRGVCRFEKSDHSGAIEDFTEAIRLDPTNARFFAHRSVALFELKQYDRAKKDRDEAARLDPSFR